MVEARPKRWRFQHHQKGGKKGSGSKGVHPPLGYNYKGEANTIQKDHLDLLLDKKAWALAKSPASSIFSTGLMGWMMGSALSIYTMFFIVFALYNPIKGILGIPAQFSPLQAQSSEGATYLPQKLVFFVLHCVALSIALYKVHSMGLLPTLPELLVDPPSIPLPEQVSIGVW